jgi:hypothetical protein
MNRFESVTDGTASHSTWLPNDGNQVAGYKPLRWLMALLMVAFVAGCGNGGGGRDPILGGSASVLQGLVSIKVTPATASIPVSGTQQYTATGTYNDGSSKDVTASSTWTAVNVPLGGAAVATILPSGVATGKVIGQSTITATLGGKSNSATLTVSSATVVSIMVTPATASIPVTGTQQYTALAILSDGLSNDVTANPLTTWTAVNVPPGGAAVATLSPSGLGAGVATGQVIGQSAITAAFGGKTSPALGAILTVIAGTTPGPAGAAPNLGTAAPFGIIAWNAITIANGHIYGDVALTQPAPAGTIASVTGAGTNDSGAAPFLASSDVTTSNGVTPGVITAADNGTPANIAALPKLHSDLNAAYLDLMGRAAPLTALTSIALAAGAPGGTFPAAAPDLSGYVLSPGIFTTSGTYGLSNTKGPLVLDAGGNADAVFIIRSTAVGPSGLTSTSGSVVLKGGAQSKNVFWLVDNLTIGSGTFFQGTVVAGHAITLGTFANVEGRMLAGALGLVSGAITLASTSTITVPK